MEPPAKSIGRKGAEEEALCQEESGHSVEDKAMKRKRERTMMPKGSERRKEAVAKNVSRSRE